MIHHQRFQRVFPVLLVWAVFIAFSACPVMAAAKKININTATVEELQTLPKIGPKTAKAIVKYRKKHPFKDVDELLEVKGIGEKTLKKIKPMVTVGKTKASKKSEKKSKKKKK